jgi:ankyrin repeat protein
VKWLVESRGAEIETCDRGQFTPLLNAAWAGDRALVRFLLIKGADRSKIGTCHYTKPLSAPDFQGMSAEDWAKDRGHDEIATLIRLGL